jgi:hypothetical protein
MKEDVMKTRKKIVKANPKKLSVIAQPEPKSTLYDKDFYQWTKIQSALLKKKQLSELDIKNLMEEIESLGKNDRRALRSQARRLLMHLLKQKYQPEQQGNSNSWSSSIFDARKEIKYLIEDSPSLRNELKKIYLDAYEDARQEAAAETKLNIKTFPEECLWTFEEIFPDLKKK